LLTPYIVEAILEARGDDALMLERLERPLPASWEEQRRLIGSAPPPWGANAMHGLLGVTR
jgi:hypothetical protein